MTFQGEKEPIWKKPVKYNGEIYESQSHLASVLGVTRQAVSYCLKKGYKIKGNEIILEKKS